MGHPGTRDPEVPDTYLRRWNALLAVTDVTSGCGKESWTSAAKAAVRVQRLWHDWSRALPIFRSRL